MTLRGTSTVSMLIAVLVLMAASCGSPGRGTLSGHVYLVGGPAPGSPVAVTGTVVATHGSSRYTAQTGSDGSYTLQVPAGDYSVSATSPRYTGPCIPATKATVKVARRSVANVYCQMA